MEYLKRVIAASEEARSPASKAKALGAAGSTSITVNVPSAGKTNGEATTMDDLLGGFEDELDIDREDFDDDEGARMAQEVNLLKQASEQQMDMAM